MKWPATLELSSPEGSWYLELATSHGQIMPQTKAKSLADIFWSFVEEHPEAAAGLAFQLGLWAGEATDTKKALKSARRFPSKIREAMPQSISEAALRFLPSPGLQPTAVKKRKPHKRQKGRARAA